MDSRRIEQIRKEASEERRTLRGGDGLSAHFAGLCLELLEHIIEQSALVSRLRAQLQSASYREVLNLRTMVARLTPLEFLLAKGGDPMDQMAEKIRELSDKLNRTESIGSKLPMAPHIFAQMVNRVRDLAFDFGTCEQFRDRVSELLGKYVDSDGKAPGAVEARRVVVPELTEEALVRAGGPYCINDREPFQRGARWAAAFIREHSRAIPADRVLGDRMAAVPMELLERLYSFVGDSPNMISAMQFQAEISDALRANQEGDSHAR